MTRKINYEDDLFALSLLVRTLRDLAQLEVDAELFRDAVLAVLAAVEQAAERIGTGLQASPFLVHRDEHLRELQKLERSLAVLMEELGGGKAALAAGLRDRADGFLVSAAAHENQADAIDGLLDGTSGVDDGHIVSAEELRFLTAPPDEADDAS
jgi:hypothetical protein